MSVYAPEDHAHIRGLLEKSTGREPFFPAYDASDDLQKLHRFMDFHFSDFLIAHQGRKIVDIAIDLLSRQVASENSPEIERKSADVVINDPNGGRVGRV